MLDKLEYGWIINEGIDNQFSRWVSEETIQDCYITERESERGGVRVGEGDGQERKAFFKDLPEEQGGNTGFDANDEMVLCNFLASPD